MSRRDRQKQGKLGRDWAPLYENVLATEAVRTLPLAHYKLYITISALCKPWLNGAVPLSRRVLKESFGILSGCTINRALADLIERKLIVRTRKARPRHAALYGVVHLALNHDAMKKAGAHDPGDGSSTPSCSRTETATPTPSNMRTEFSVLPQDRERYHHRTELTQKSTHSVLPQDRIKRFSTSNSVLPQDQSKNLPGPPGSAAGSDHGS